MFFLWPIIILRFNEQYIEFIKHYGGVLGGVAIFVNCRSFLFIAL